jgi:hypothetical protein
MLTLSKKGLVIPSPYTRWRLAGIIVVAVMTIMTVVCFYFIYKSVFGIIDAQSTIARLRAEPNITPLDETGLIKAKEILKLKDTTISYPSTIRNVFVYASSSPSVYEPSTTTTPTAQ